LEPCSHHGRTPPCVDALIKAGVTRVVAAMGDPNPRVGGEGFRKLQSAGIALETGVCAAEAEAQHRGFLNVIRHQRPMLTLKLATTLDGRIATATGESRWITGPEARRAVHAMRLNHDAVLVGGGTARVDDPTLTVRDMGAVRQPVRIVASRRLNIPWPNKLADSVAQGPVWIAHGEGAQDTPEAARWREVGANLLAAPINGRQIDPHGLLRALAAKGLTRVFCEGGGALAASLLGAGLVDELIVMSAGLVLGAEGKPAVGALGLSALSDAERFELVETRRVGGDVLQHWRKT
ncbi:bifunctional diaminohydroxyphosphoribosylaminopyrimidine deaminase/5-amino-6-(5-phosphoribosylamino)uracil reductase RibD, partial [bacterium]|nr:bifunctional diaminohydroxyphosphoribosylaminopyrimidine deaminase/5-amino-6-(5-phosphoribosylamino)uracil reductase RibD [bacterium]